MLSYFSSNVETFYEYSSKKEPLAGVRKTVNGAYRHRYALRFLCSYKHPWLSLWESCHRRWLRGAFGTVMFTLSALPSLSHLAQRENQVTHPTHYTGRCIEVRSLFVRQMGVCLTVFTLRIHRQLSISFCLFNAVIISLIPGSPLIAQRMPSQFVVLIMSCNFAFSFFIVNLLYLFFTSYRNIPDHETANIYLCEWI